MDFSQRFNQKGLSDVTLRLRTTVAVPARKGLANRKRARAEEVDPASERFFHLHKVILFQSPYFEQMHERQADGSLGRTPSGQLHKKPRKKMPCGTPEEPASDKASSNVSAELVMLVEECELEAVELLLKCLYKAELPEEARSHGRLMLQVRPGFWIPDMQPSPAHRRVKGQASGPIEATIIPVCSFSPPWS